jgi:hypothetical protein
MLFVENCMQKEATRLNECLDISTKDKLINILEAQLLGQFMDKVLNIPPSLMDLMEKEDEADIMSLIVKNRTEFDTFMLEKRIDDL